MFYQVNKDINFMKSKGFGDSVEKFTKATGIKTIVDNVSQGLNIPCGCEQRRDALNKMIPYKKGSEYRAALAAGELDFTITTMGKDGEICPIVFWILHRTQYQNTTTLSHRFKL